MARQRAYDAIRAAREAGERHREAVAVVRGPNEVALGINHLGQRRVAVLNPITGRYEIRNG